MFPENDIDEFMHNENDIETIFDDLTEGELKIQIKSYKFMQKLAEQGKRIYTFDQEWLM